MPNPRDVAKASYGDVVKQEFGKKEVVKKEFVKKELVKKEHVKKEVVKLEIKLEKMSKEADGGDLCRERLERELAELTVKTAEAGNEIRARAKQAKADFFAAFMQQIQKIPVDIRNARLGDFLATMRGKDNEDEEEEEEEEEKADKCKEQPLADIMRVKNECEAKQRRTMPIRRSTSPASRASTSRASAYHTPPSRAPLASSSPPRRPLVGNEPLFSAAGTPLSLGPLQQLREVLTSDASVLSPESQQLAHAVRNFLRRGGQ